jgi:flagellar L-ring protein FlgH
MGNVARNFRVTLLLALFAASPLAAQGATGTTGQAQQDTTAPKPAVKRPGLSSWTTDRRDFVVGDVITIVVDELTVASADKSNVDSKDRGTDAGLGWSTPGGSSASSVTFRTKLDAASAARGQARRRDVLTTELSARVVSIEEGGLLKVEGSRTIKLDKNEQKVTITGFVRAQDISARNFVESWRLANAELAYESKGDLANPKQGILTKILGILWP